MLTSGSLSDGRVDSWTFGLLGSRSTQVSRAPQEQEVAYEAGKANICLQVVWYVCLS
jgi:hypothetical protein